MQGLAEKHLRNLEAAHGGSGVKVRPYFSGGGDATKLWQEMESLPSIGVSCQSIDPQQENPKMRTRN